MLALHQFIIAIRGGPVAAGVDLFDVVMKWGERATVAGLLLAILVTYYLGYWYSKREYQKGEAEIAELRKKLATVEAESVRWRDMVFELAGLTEKYAKIVDPAIPSAPAAVSQRNDTNPSSFGGPYGRQQQQRGGPESSGIPFGGVPSTFELDRSVEEGSKQQRPNS